MKKLLSLLLLAVSLTSHSQSIDKVSEKHFLSYTGGEWRTISTTYPTDVHLVFNGSEIIVDGEDRKIVTYGSPEKTDNPYNELYSWDAYDNNSRKCALIMLKYKGSKKYMVTIAYIYDNYGYEYIVND